MRRLLPLLLLAGLLMPATALWVEDTLGTVILVAGDTFVYDTLPADESHYPRSRVWAYGIAFGQEVEPAAPDLWVEWRWETFNAYDKSEWYFSDWYKVLPNPWDSLWGGANAGNIVVFDSLYLSRVVDNTFASATPAFGIPLGWIGHLRFRVIAAALAETTLFQLFVRKRHGSEVGYGEFDQLQFEEVEILQ